MKEINEFGKRERAEDPLNLTPPENAAIFAILSPEEQRDQILNTILAVRDATSPEDAAIAQEILNRQLRDTTLDELDLYEGYIGDVGAIALATALANNHTIKTLDLKDNDIGPDGATALATALANNHTLERLELYENDIGSDGATALATALKNNNTLKTLYLGVNAIGDLGATALATALENNHTLERLDLCHNAIGPGGATALATALENNHILERLDLGNNAIGPGGATALATALENNHSLKTLELPNNAIGDDGATALATALVQKNYTLEKLWRLDEYINDDLNAAVKQKLSLNKSVNEEATPMRRAGTYATCMIANRRSDETLEQEKPDNATWIDRLPTEIFAKIAREVHRDKGAWVNAVVEKRAEAKQHGMDITL